ncbi:PREDICTED: uncharacterized protein LOC109176857 [Ipomoea nil]|uniref:uncharacterized protein LOC109176857 n=1 Tax=Ipomoea nil TaxID=35883 RepID=UPI000900E229|nr:PREDICTED: uncharacterized protein LOC109176857 [Ipomoea nil]
MEIQIAQLVKLVSERPCGSLPSTTENNPKEIVNAISVHLELVNEDTNKGYEGKSAKGKEVLKDTNTEESKANTKMVTSQYRAQILFPQRLVNMAELEQQGKFNDLLRKLHVNMPFLRTLRELPRLTCHLKELVKHKEEIHNESRAHLSVECSAALERGCPKKKGDPGAFVVPCTVKELFFENALADLGASINVMPSCVFDKMIMLALTPTQMTVQLADGSTRYPRGIAEDVLVRIKDFVIPVDFVVLDVGQQNENMPLIFRKPFFAICRAIIDVGAGKLTLRIDDEDATFGMTIKEDNKKKALKLKKKSKTKASCSGKTGNFVWRKKWVCMQSTGSEND